MTPQSARDRPLIGRILAATDYSAAAHRAVCRAGQLARQHGSGLYLVHAQPDWNLFSRSSAVTAEQYWAIVRHADEALTRELAHLKQAFGINARGENRIGRASEVLMRAVADTAPQLIVMGARGEHELPAGPPFLGGTALKMVAFAPCPVLLVRSAADAPYRSCLAAVEGSELAPRDLVRWAKALMPEGDCHAVHVFDVPYAERIRAQGVASDTLRAWGADFRRAAGRELEQMAAGESDAHVRVHADVIEGEPVRGLLAEIERRRPEFVVLGKHRRPARESPLLSLGSVAQRIAYHGSGDVLVVP